MVSPPLSVFIKSVNFLSLGEVMAAIMARIRRITPSQDRNFILHYFPKDTALEIHSMFQILKKIMVNFKTC